MLIKSKHSTGIIIVGSLLIVMASAAALMLTKFQPTTNVFLGSGVFEARVAHTEKSRTKGLGGVAKLSPNQAMLFAFPRDDHWQIWMKNMQVPIDIVWLDAEKKMIYGVKNVAPDNTSIFTPTEPARYVVELPAGSIDTYAIKTGQAGVFTIKQEDIK